jgi:8-oxo-dGTP pyrophosphatase MutT (NUDIX family)
VVEINETSEEAAIREVFEETGFNLEIDRLICIQERFFKVGIQKCHEIDLFYLMKDNKNFNVENNSYTDQAPKETLHWILIDDLPKTDIVPESIKSFCFDNLSDIIHIISKE